MKLFIQESAFENVVCKMATILSRQECADENFIALFFLCMPAALGMVRTTNSPYLPSFLGVAIVATLLIIVVCLYRSRQQQRNSHPVIVMKDNQYYMKVSEGIGYNITPDPLWEYPREKWVNLSHDDVMTWKRGPYYWP